MLLVSHYSIVISMVNIQMSSTLVPPVLIFTYSVYVSPVYASRIKITDCYSVEQTP